MNISFYGNSKMLGAKLTGELDHHGVPKVRESIDKKILNGTNNLELDLTGLSFMDSSGIGLIIGRYKLICGIGGTMRLVTGNNKCINKIIAMSGISRLMPVITK